MDQKDIKPGQPIKAEFLNELNKAAKQLKQLKAAPPLMISQTPAGPVIRLAEIPTPAGTFEAVITGHSENFQYARYSFQERILSNSPSWNTKVGGREGWANIEDVPVGEDEEPPTPNEFDGYALERNGFRFVPWGTSVVLTPHIATDGRKYYLFTAPKYEVEGYLKTWNGSSGGTMSPWIRVPDQYVDASENNFENRISFTNPNQAELLTIDGSVAGIRVFLNWENFSWRLESMGCKPYPNFYENLGSG